MSAEISMFRGSEQFEAGDYIHFGTKPKRVYKVLAFNSRSSIYTIEHVPRLRWWAHKIATWAARAWQHAKDNIEDTPYP